MYYKVTNEELSLKANDFWGGIYEDFNDRFNSSNCSMSCTGLHIKQFRERINKN